MATLTMTQFLKFLEKECAIKSEAPESSVPLFSDELARLRVYKEIKLLITVFLQDYAEEKRLTKKAEESFLDAIETDKRREFDDPADLIAHIGQIASKPPFFDSERISLAAIQGFCNDFLNRHKKQVYQEQVQHAPF